MTARKLTPKQQRFVEEYLVDLNATQAAIRAGYSERTARSQGSRLLTNADISRAIGAAKQQRAQRTELDADWVLSGLREVAERCMTAVPVVRFDFTEKAMVPVLDDEGNGVWQFDSRGANRAIELVGKHLGMFVDRHEHSGPGGKPIPVETLTTPSDPEQLFRDHADLLKAAIGSG